jgi:hypothetical protein
VKVTLDLPKSVLRLLAVLDDHGRAEGTLLQLAARAADGVCRPGAWERQRLYQAFGAHWETRLEPDPDAPAWRQCPARRRRRP